MSKDFKDTDTLDWVDEFADDDVNGPLNFGDDDPDADTLICQDCGIINEEDANHCDSCGFPLDHEG